MADGGVGVCVREGGGRGKGKGETVDAEPRSNGSLGSATSIRLKCINR